MRLYSHFPFWLMLYIVWNFAGFFMVMMDKRWAKAGEWRIRERTFFIWALVFGAVGILLGMHVFHHKTRHWAFVVGMPILCLVNFAFYQIFLT